MTQPTNAQRIAELCQPLVPEPTGVEPRLQTLANIRAVLFDIYGTLMISGSGDIGVAKDLARSEAFVAAIQSAGLNSDASQIDGTAGSQQLLVEIQSTHEQLKSQGIAYPEVDIHHIWQATVETLITTGKLPAAAAALDPARLALEYELRVNPVWPMPHWGELLADLRGRDCTLGLISNAQLFTPEILSQLAGKTLDELGFHPNLRFYSFEQQQAKPGLFLYEIARNCLAEMGIPAETVLYVGNDMLNDIAPAAEVGFRTALFAGDARSLRWRTDDPRVADQQPNVVVTDLLQIAECL